MARRKDVTLSETNETPGWLRTGVTLKTAGGLEALEGVAMLSVTWFMGNCAIGVRGLLWRVGVTNKF